MADVAHGVNEWTHHARTQMHMSTFIARTSFRASYNACASDDIGLHLSPLDFADQPCLIPPLEAQEDRLHLGHRTAHVRPAALELADSAAHMLDKLVR